MKKAGQEEPELSKAELEEIERTTSSLLAEARSYRGEESQAGAEKERIFDFLDKLDEAEKLIRLQAEVSDVLQEQKELRETLITEQELLSQHYSDAVAELVGYISPRTRWITRLTSLVVLTISMVFLPLTSLRIVGAQAVFFLLFFCNIGLAYLAFAVSKPNPNSPDETLAGPQWLKKGAADRSSIRALPPNDVPRKDKIP